MARTIWRLDKRHYKSCVKIAAIKANV